VSLDGTPIRFGKSTEIFQNFGMFLAHHKTVAKQPQFTTNPPQSHHKKTTSKTHIFQNPPQKWQ
jgi:hypothetical protein